MCQVNNSINFSRKPIGPEEFLIQMVEALGIIIDRSPKGRPGKLKHRKNKMYPYCKLTAGVHLILKENI